MEDRPTRAVMTTLFRSGGDGARGVAGIFCRPPPPVTSMSLESVTNSGSKSNSPDPVAEHLTVAQHERLFGSPKTEANSLF